MNYITKDDFEQFKINLSVGLIIISIIIISFVWVCGTLLHLHP